MSRADDDGRLTVGKPVQIRAGSDLLNGEVTIIGGVMVAVLVRTPHELRDDSAATYWRHPHEVYDRDE